MSSRDDLGSDLHPEGDAYPLADPDPGPSGLRHLLLELAATLRPDDAGHAAALARGLRLARLDGLDALHGPGGPPPPGDDDGVRLVLEDGAGAVAFDTALAEAHRAADHGRLRVHGWRAPNGAMLWVGLRRVLSAAQRLERGPVPASITPGPGLGRLDARCVVPGPAWIAEIRPAGTTEAVWPDPGPPAHQRRAVLELGHNLAAEVAEAESGVPEVTLHCDPGAGLGRTTPDCGPPPAVGTLGAAAPDADGRLRIDGGDCFSIAPALELFDPNRPGAALRAGVSAAPAGPIAAGAEFAVVAIYGHDGGEIVRFPRMAIDFPGGMLEILEVAVPEGDPPLPGEAPIAVSLQEIVVEPGGCMIGGHAFRVRIRVRARIPIAADNPAVLTVQAVPTVFDPHRQNNTVTLAVPGGPATGYPTVPSSDIEIGTVECPPPPPPPPPVDWRDLRARILDRTLAVRSHCRPCRGGCAELVAAYRALVRIWKRARLATLAATMARDALEEAACRWRAEQARRRARRIRVALHASDDRRASVAIQFSRPERSRLEAVTLDVLVRVTRYDEVEEELAVLAGYVEGGPEPAEPAIGLVADSVAVARLGRWLPARMLRMAEGRWRLRASFVVDGVADDPSRTGPLPDELSGYDALRARFRLVLADPPPPGARLEVDVVGRGLEIGEEEPRRWEGRAVHTYPGALPELDDGEDEEEA